MFRYCEHEPATPFADFAIGNRRQPWAERPAKIAHHLLDQLSAEDFQRIYAVNTIGPYQMVRAARSLLEAGAKAADKFKHDWKLMPPQSCSGCHR